MKILYYTHKFGFVTETFIYNEVTGLSEYAEVEVLSNVRENEERFPYPKVSFIRHYENNTVGNLLKRWNDNVPPLLGLPSFRRDWIRHVKRIRPDAIIIPFGTIATRILGYHDFNMGVPVLIIFHGYDASSELSNPSYKKALTQLTLRPDVHAAFVSDEMRQRMKANGICFPNNSVLYCGVNTERFKRRTYQHPRTPYVFLQVSSFAEKKGHEYTLRAFAQFLAQNPEQEGGVILRLGGGGGRMAAMQTLAATLGLTESVEFLGWVSVEENVELMENAHCFIHHSVTDSTGNKEGIPTVIMEAMSMELPIISTRHSGIPELVEEGTHGYLVDERDVDAYAKCMAEVMERGYQRENRKKILSAFGEPIHNKALYQLLDNIIQ